MKYNGCTNGELPDMSAFTQLKINAVYPYESEDGSTYCEALLGVVSKKADLSTYLVDGEDPSKVFYSVYGRYENGEVEVLHDEPTTEEILKVAKDLSSRFGLEVILN